MEKETPDSSHSKGSFRHWLLWGGLAYVGLAVLMGLMAGLGIFTFGYGQGASYMSNNPMACVNCHVMDDHYDSWQNSSHSHVAVCNDCHLSPHPVGRWVTKADNGFFHSWAFTTGDFPDPIQIKPRNRRVTQKACLHCHGDFVHPMQHAAFKGEELLCVSCHSAVGHAHR